MQASYLQIEEQERIQQIVDEVKKIDPNFNPALEYPFAIEDAFLLWLKKTCGNDIKKLNIALDDIRCDLSDGRVIAEAVFYYFPSVLPIDS